MHYFRGVAILIIIVVHVWMNPLTRKNPDNIDWVGIIRESLFDGSTIYFILISGFLFQYLSGRFKLFKYYGNKLKYIILPYAILTAFYLAVRYVGGAEVTPFDTYIPELLHLLYVGTGAMWYIPFISVIFLFSPLVLQIPERYRIRYFPYLLLIPLLGTRTEMEITLGQYAYFAPIYLFGMYLCLKFDYVMGLVKKYRKLILSLLIGLTILLFYAWYTGYQYAHEHLYLAVLYVRNMLACFYIIYVLEKGRDNYKYWLDQIAEYSFALFFTHTFLHWKITHKGLVYVSRWFDEYTMIFISILYLPLFVLLNLYLCKFLKRMLGKYSRYIIGV